MFLLECGVIAVIGVSKGIGTNSIGHNMWDVPSSEGVLKIPGTGSKIHEAPLLRTHFSSISNTSSLLTGFGI